MFNAHQQEILERNRHVYDLFVRAGVVSNAHHAITEINNVHQQVYGTRFNQSCGGCVADALNKIYVQLDQSLK